MSNGNVHIAEPNFFFENSRGTVKKWHTHTLQSLQPESFLRVNKNALYWLWGENKMENLHFPILSTASNCWLGKFSFNWFSLRSPYAAQSSNQLMTNKFKKHPKRVVCCRRDDLVRDKDKRSTRGEVIRVDNQQNENLWFGESSLSVEKRL